MERAIVAQNCTLHARGRRDQGNPSSNSWTVRHAAEQSGSSHVSYPKTSIDLNDSGALDDGRFFLALRKMLSAFSIDIDAGKLFAVMIINSDLPMTVLAPTIFLEPGRTPCFLLIHDFFLPPIGNARHYRKFTKPAQVAT